MAGRVGRQTVLQGAGLVVGSGLLNSCHGSTFETTTGKVLGGPARKALTAYAITVADASIVAA